MTRRKKSPGTRDTRKSARAQTVAPRRSRAVAGLLGASFVVLLGILLVLVALDVRLGQGYFAYRYSPVRNLRTPRAAPAVVLGAAVAGVIVLLNRCGRKRGRGVVPHAILATAMLG